MVINLYNHLNELELILIKRNEMSASIMAS